MANEKNGNLFKRLSLVPAGLRYKLMIVFCLMSIIPLLICVYITTTYVFPNVGLMGSLSLIIIITIIIALLGFAVAKSMIEPIIDISIEAKLIASGDFERSVEVDEEGEVGEIADSLNSMTEKIRSNISELKSYGDKTREINTEIHKKVMVLSGLLQVGNLISGGSDLKTIMDILVEKISMLDGTSPAAIMMLDDDTQNMVPLAYINIGDPETAKMSVSLKHGLFARLRTEPKDIIVDKNLQEENEDVESFRELYNVKNTIVIPIIIRGTVKGALFMGNNEDNFEYDKDDIELLHVFCKQAAIAIENDELIKKTEELQVKDELTQLYNNKYIRERLEEEIKRGMVYQRPCSLILFNVDNFKAFCENHGRVAGDSALRKMAILISGELTPVDKAARFSDDGFALLLPERNKKEAKDIAEEIKDKIAGLVVLPEAEDDKDKRLTVSGGLSENPIDGTSAKELMDKAQELIKQAKDAGKNRVKV